MKTRIVWGAAALALVAAMGLVTAEVVREQKSARGPRQPPDSAEVDSVKGQLEELRSQVTRLQADRGVPDGSRPTARAPAAAPPRAVAETVPEPPPPSREDELAFIEHQFQNESRDPAWTEAGALGGKLAKLLPRGSSVRSLDCRSSLCRLEMQHADLAAHRAFFDRFVLSEGIGGVWKGATSFEVQTPAHEGEPVNVVAYLARDDLPTLAAQ